MRRLALGITLLIALGAGVLLAGTPPRENLLASFATTLQGRTDKQWHNAELSLNKLDGAVVGPGEIFSFNGRVGTYSRDAGYLKAPVSYNGTLIDSWGGGVCQTSTTLYNAAMLAGMELLERSPHRFAPSYVAPGRDAAVAFDSIDLKFRNPYDFPVHVRAQIEGRRLVVSLLGSKPLSVKPALVTEVRERIEPREYVIQGGGRFGRVRNAGKPGWEVAVYRVWPDKRELLSTNSYPPMHRITEYRD